MRRHLEWLVAVVLVLAGIAHVLHPKKVDALAVGLVVAGALVLAVDPKLLQWSKQHLTGLKVGGFLELALAPSPVSEENTEDPQSAESAPSNLAELQDQLEERLRSAAEWIALPDASALSIRQLLRKLARGGYLDRLDTTTLELVFDSSSAATPAQSKRAAAALSDRLRIGMLIRAAELSFERCGLATQRPGAPFSKTHFHFSVSTPSRGTLFVGVVIALSKDSKLAPARAAQMATIPVPGRRWLVPQQSIQPFKNEAVRVIPIGHLDVAVEQLIKP